MNTVKKYCFINSELERLTFLIEIWREIEDGKESLGGTETILSIIRGSREDCERFIEYSFSYFEMNKIKKRGDSYTFFNKPPSRKDYHTLIKMLFKYENEMIKAIIKIYNKLKKKSCSSINLG